MSAPDVARLLTRRRVLFGAAALGATAVSRRALAGRTRLRISRHRVPFSGRRRVRVAHLTDLHLGWTTPKRFLDEVAHVVRTLEPDLVVLTGDYVNRGLAHRDALAGFVRQLPGPVVATLGNHDHWSGAEALSEALREGGAEVLANEHTVVEGRGFTLDVVGVDDGFTKNHDLAKAFAGNLRLERTLVLSHFPSIADEISQTGARLVLSGHTHGGQLVIPGLTHALSRLAGNRYFHGWYTLGDTDLYVSAGIGHALEGMRHGDTAVPEIAVYELDPRATERDHRQYSAL